MATEMTLESGRSSSAGRRLDAGHPPAPLPAGQPAAGQAGAGRGQRHGGGDRRTGGVDQGRGDRLDIDPAMVAFARQRGRQKHAAQGGRAEYRLGRRPRSAFPDGWFDVTACHFVLLWCRDPGRAAEEMKRVTRPGGMVPGLRRAGLWRADRSPRPADRPLAG